MSGNRQNPILPNGLGSPYNIYTAYTDTDRPHRTGTRGWLPDGRVFYWCRNATTTALTRNLAVAQPASTTNHLEQTVAAAADFTAGALTVTLNVGATAILLREYEEGYVAIASAAALANGTGNVYQIRSHAGNAGSVTSTAKVYTPVQFSADATAKFSLYRNPYMNPIVCPTSQAALPSGVPLVTLPAATSVATATVEAVGATYGWVQTWGPCAVQADEAITANQAEIMGTGTAGDVENDTTVTATPQLFVLGYSMSAASDTVFFLTDLRIRP